MRVRHLILDRDGVLNREAPGLGHITDPDDWVWIDGSLDALARLTAGGVRLSVVTNQSVVGRGGATLAQIEAVHARMRAEAAAVGAQIAEVLLCPHAPDDGCTCRKPAPELVIEAVRRSGIAAESTVMVGDSATDLQAARAAGVEAVLVRTGKGAGVEVADGLAFADLACVATWVLERQDCTLTGEEKQE